MFSVIIKETDSCYQVYNLSVSFKHIYRWSRCTHTQSNNLINRLGKTLVQRTSQIAEIKTWVYFWCYGRGRGALGGRLAKWCRHGHPTVTISSLVFPLHGQEPWMWETLRLGLGLPGHNGDTLIFSRRHVLLWGKGRELLHHPHTGPPQGAVQLQNLVGRPPADNVSDGGEVQLRLTAQVAPEVQVGEHQVSQGVNHLGLSVRQLGLMEDLMLQGDVAQRLLRQPRASAEGVVAAALLGRMQQLFVGVGMLGPGSLFVVEGFPLLVSDQPLLWAAWQQLVQAFISQVCQVSHQQLLNDLLPHERRRDSTDAMQPSSCRRHKVNHSAC